MPQLRLFTRISAISALIAAVLALTAVTQAQAQEPGAEPPPPPPSGQQPPPTGQEQPPAGQQPPPAQDPPPAAEPAEPAPPAGQQQTPEVTDEQIEQFASAYSEVAELRDTYTQDIVQAEDPDRATELQQEANEKMIEVVEGSGLSVGEYNQIAEAMDRDPELQERILERVEE